MKTKSCTIQMRSLRKQAEARAVRGDVSAQEQLSPEQVRHVLHELNVYQIQLEMQNKELRSVQHELEVSQSRYFDLYDLAPVGYLTLNDQGQILKANLTAVTMLGLEKNDLIRKPLTRFIFHEDQDIYYLNIFNMGESDDIKDCELRLVDGSGQPIWVHLQATKKRADELLITFSNITERKQMEEEKLALEQQLQQTQKLESLGVLAGGIAHDFNNILAVIIGRCELTKLNYAKAEQHIPDIERAAERAAELCRQMLAYAGKSNFIEASVNMSLLVKDTISLLRSSLSQNVTILLNLPDRIPVVKGDESQIRQIVINLIMNAAESIGEAKGEVLVSLERKSVKGEKPCKGYFGTDIPAGSYLCLEVTDDGCGMDEVTQQRIFEPFYTTKFPGRGLGMSAVLGIIKPHHGTLQLFSRLGQGTTIKVYFPVSESHDTRDQAPLATPADPWRGSGTILLVEDDAQLLLIVKTMLETLGFVVIEAHNGKEALELYQEHAGDITLVMTNISMPEMDGYTLFGELRLHNPELPIIISSGFEHMIITSHINPEGISGFASKPYNLVQLQEVLKSVVEDIIRRNPETGLAGHGRAKTV